MNATVWTIIAIIGFSLAGICLVVSIFIFIKLNIPAVIGDLTGKTVAREVKAMRENEAMGQKKNYSFGGANYSYVDNESKKENVIDSKLMGKAHASRRLDFTSGQLNSTKDENATEVLTSNATEVLTSNATEVLTSNATEVLVSNETEVLSSNVLNGTTVLSNTEELEVVEELPVTFKIIRTLTYIHSEEIIF